MITLYTAPTPNGFKVSILLEELGVKYEVRHIKLDKKEQKEEWYLKLNPNGRIPTIVDHENGDFPVFESGAILFYLAEKYGKFLSKDPKQKSVALQWVFFQMAGVGPNIGYVYIFKHMMQEKMPAAIERFTKESRRLLEVLDRRLQGREYLVDEYSIADIANFTWVRRYEAAEISIEGLDNLKAWLKRIESRPAVIRGLNIPISH